MEKYYPKKIEKKWPSSAKATEGKLKKYEPLSIEKKWQQIWERENLYKAEDFSERPKFYCLDMFPYPSGEGLHVGHWRGYVLSDVISRYQMLKGKNVLHPMGWDAFGLPAENAAIKNKSHPKVFINRAIEVFRKQIRQIGAMIDWSREINTSDPSYYHWTQWLFLKLYQAGLAYRKKAPVNWCPSCQTVLANEQVIGGLCERCNSTVVKKELTQWFFKITEFAEDLLNDLAGLDWPERTKTLQRNWIGKSEGTLIKFPIPNSQFPIEVFTTRADTLFGATYIVISPGHPIVEEIDDYIGKAKKIDGAEIDKEKTGVIIEGVSVINPANKERIPIWISDYIVMDYGTGVCMAVPAHDQRDFEFAQKFNLPIKMVICPNYPEPKCPILDKAFVDDGFLIESGKFTGLKSSDGREKIVKELQKENLARKIVSFRLRDWLISRQRYWGAPIPIIYCEEHGEVPVPEKDLPIKLPEDVEFKPTGVSPLKSSEEFLNTTCPKCGKQAKRESDTMDTFVDSAWYYLRYSDPQNKQEYADKEKVRYWLPVDFYFGGIEHAILHLLYARFISKAIHQLKIIDFASNDEPFQKLFNIGMVYLHGAKMSKSKGNVVSPDELIKKYGTDSLRGYELFIGPADQDAEWQIAGISGIYRFLEKIWQVFQEKFGNDDDKDPVIEKTIKIVTEEIELIRPNTAISHLMELFNYLKKKKTISVSYAQKIIILLSPFFPHLADELWQKQGHKKSVFLEKWPEYDEDLIKHQSIIIAVQINGKTKEILEFDNAASQEIIESKSKQSPKISRYLQDKKIKKVIFITGRVINFVIE